MTRPEVREALFLASPDAVDALPRWREDADDRRGRRLERTLVRYLARMAGRATPFGLFAGCSVGLLGDETRLALGGLASYRRHTRLDSHALGLLVRAVESDPGLRRGLAFRPNSSLYEFGGTYRYAECRVGQESRSYHLVAVQPSDALRSTLLRAQHGARLETLASALVDGEITLSDAEAYVAELVHSQILVADLEPPVTGREPVLELASRLRPHADTREMAALLEELQADLADLDLRGPGVEPQRYHDLATRLAGLPITPDVRRLFQVDMAKPAAHASLGGPVVEELVRGIGILHRVVPRGGDALAGFRAAFVKRYGLREVPLVEALDEDGGIGLEGLPGDATEDSPLLRGLPLPTGDADGGHARWSARDDFLARRIEDCLRAGALEMTLAAEDLEALDVERPDPLPDAFAVIATLAARSEEACQAGEFRVSLQGSSGPSGAMLLGRFCHSDPSLRQHVERHIRAEEALRPDAAFAEIVHLPEGRDGNILLRPVFRAHEIPFLGRSGRPAEKQLPVTDLHVRVHGARIGLRSARLGCEVVPRLTSAHAFARRGLGIYRFLCFLQRAGVAGSLSWSWGALSRLSFLPRVSTGRLVLSLAQWRLGRQEIERLRQGDGTKRYRSVQAVRRERGLPRFVSLVQAGSRLLVDLDNALSVDVLLHLIERRTEAVLVEHFPGADELVAHGPEGRFVHELIVPFVRRGAEGQAAPVTPKRSPGEVATVVRRCPPGSEWLYAKLYAGPAAVDRILLDMLPPFIERCRTAGWMERWFFVRYADPDWHLRLRFQGEPGTLFGSLLPALREAVAPPLADGRLWRLELDTYEREVERYGGPEGMALAEDFFQCDSDAVLAVLPLACRDEGVEDRWRITLLGLDMLLADFGFDTARKMTLIEDALVSLLEGANGLSRPLKHKLGERFRELRPSLDGLFDATRDKSPTREGALRMLRRRSRESTPIIQGLRSARTTGRLRSSVEAIALDYLHLFANRMLRSAQKSQELVLYDFLRRSYESAAARQPGGAS